jgi:hypothetical protein
MYQAARGFDHPIGDLRQVGFFNRAEGPSGGHVEVGQGEVVFAKPISGPLHQGKDARRVEVEVLGDIS